LLAGSEKWLLLAYFSAKNTTTSGIDSTDGSGFSHFGFVARFKQFEVSEQ
jgi:hypothetical protein